MSFKDDYKNQIESLSADGYLKEKVLKKIEEKEKKKSFNFLSFKSLAVAALCLVLAVAIALPGTRNFFTDKFKSASEIKNPAVSSENVTVDKEDIETDIDTKEYNYDEISDATPGPVEIWADTLQFIFILNQNEVDASEGIDVPETYDWYFDLYYKPYDAMDEELGGYKKVPLQAWSCYRFGDYDGGILYRCKFYDTGLGSLEEGEYEAKLVVRQGDEIKGWYDMGALSWTDSCLSFIHYAENNSDIFK